MKLYIKEKTMNKTLLLAGVAACLFSANANAFDATPYVSAKLRYSDMSADVSELDVKRDVDDKVLGGSFAAGVSTKVNGGAVRAELEYNKNADAKKTHNLYGRQVNMEIESQLFMINGYYDIDTGSKLTPYVGAGIGYAKIKGKLSVLGESYSEDDNNFAWQVGAGVGYALNDKVSLDAGYRYVDYGDFTKEGLKWESSAHELYVGARYAF